MRFYKLKYDLDNYPKAVEVTSRDEIVGWCPLYGREHPAILKGKKGEEAILTIDLPSPKIGDFLATWGTWSWMITDKVAQLFEEQGFSGYKLKPVRINKVKRMRSTSSPIPKLWEFVITGFAGMAHPDSGINIKFIWKCEYCNIWEHSTFTNPAALIDHSQWDGSDFFFIYPLGNYIFVTERVKDFIEERKLTACGIIPLDQIEVNGGKTIPGGRLFYKCELDSRMSLERARAFAEPLGLWVEPEELWQRAVQLEEEQNWPDGLGRKDTQWDKEWRDFLKGYKEGILSQEVVLEQLEKMLKRYTTVQAIENIAEKIEEIKKIRL